MISDTANQGDLKKYAEMTSGALLLKANDGSAMQMSASKPNNGKSVTRPLISTGSGTISYIPLPEQELILQQDLCTRNMYSQAVPEDLRMQQEI